MTKYLIVTESVNGSERQRVVDVESATILSENQMVGAIFCLQADFEAYRKNTEQVVADLAADLESETAARKQAEADALEYKTAMQQAWADVATRDAKDATISQRIEYDGAQYDRLKELADERAVEIEKGKAQVEALEAQIEHWKGKAETLAERLRALTMC